MLRTVKLCYCDPVKNVTVAVPDEVYREARIRAAELGTSVSALVAEYLISLSSTAAEFERRRQLQRAITDGIGAFRAGDRLAREALHERSSHAVR